MNKANTTTSLNSSPNPSSYGQLVIFTATVTGGGPVGPTGSVRFSASFRVNLGFGNLNSNGMATFSTAALPVGISAITAIYSGDSNYNSSTSTPLAQTARKASTTATLTSSPNPSNYGQTVTFTLIITPQYSGTPTGSAALSLNGRPWINVILENGMAVFNTSTLPRGTDDIQAVYGGDRNFTGGTSNTVVQVVN